jgi:hypothetical protein
MVADFTKVASRGVALSIPTNPNAIPGIISIAATEAQSAARAAATAASSVTSEAQSVVTIAVSAIETAIDSIIPKNCTLGVR